MQDGNQHSEIPTHSGVYNHNMLHKNIPVSSKTIIKLDKIRMTIHGSYEV